MLDGGDLIGNCCEYVGTSGLARRNNKKTTKLSASITTKPKRLKPVKIAKSSPPDSVREPTTIRLGSDCTGLGTEAVALTMAGIMNVQYAFAADTDSTKQALLKSTHAALGLPPVVKVFDDIIGRNHSNLPDIDCYVAGAPCPPWSSAGLRKGVDDERSDVLMETVKVIQKKTPPCFLLENVAGLISKNHSDVFKQRVLKPLQLSGYTVWHRVLNTKHHGLPQNRPRLYIAGALDVKHKFRWPSAVPMHPLKKIIADKPSKRKTLADTTNQRVIKNAKKAKRKAEQESGNWTHEWRLCDVFAGKAFTKVMTSCMPCVTKARGIAGGFYWVNYLDRFTNIYELGAVQGFPDWIIDEYLSAASESQVGAAIGDAMSVNILMRVLPRLLFTAGLIKRPGDLWKDVPETAIQGSMPQSLYNKV